MRLHRFSGLRAARVVVLMGVVILVLGLSSVAPRSLPTTLLRPRLASAAITSPLRVSATNSHYLTDASGRAMYLSGSHTWDDMQDLSQGAPGAFDFNAYVNFLVAHGQNMTILWRKDLPTYCGWDTRGTWHTSPFP